MEAMEAADRDGQWWDDLAELNPEAVIFDDFDDCIVGYATRINMPAVIVYDEDLMVASMIARGLDLDEAVEYLSFNTFGLWAGEGTPMILRRFDAEE
tara:strand:+ start:2811 stop:3101 length:291 start_codon:yes stop_codon:yes gene_type:complete